MACATAESDATLIAVVADGAGTAGLAHVGAEIAVATVSSIAQLGVRAGRKDYQDILREGASLARQRLLEAAAERKAEPRDLACTLLAVIVAPMGGGALQIGDGVIVIGERSPGWRWVFWPQKGEYANTTFFLSDEKSLAEAEVASLPDDVLDVALMSDGLELLALQFATRKAHEPFFRTVLAPLHAAQGLGEVPQLSGGLSTLLGSPAVRSRTDDDATLVIATRHQPAA
jgi:Protein phosphatase 2C